MLRIVLDLGMTWTALRRHWRLFLAIHLGANLFVAAVLGPALTLVLGWLVLASGNAALTDEDILRALFSPPGFILFMVGIALVISVAVFAGAATLVAARRLRQGKGINPWRLGRYLVWRFPDIFRLALRMAVRAFVLAAPFLGLAGWAYLRWLTEYDINYYLDAHPHDFWIAAAVIGLALAVMVMLLLRMLSGWVLALPLLLFGHGRAGEVLAMSRERVAPYRGRVFRFIASWSILFGGLLVLSGWLLDLSADALVALAGNSLQAVAWLMGGLFLTWSGLTVLIGLFASINLVLGVLLLFEKLVHENPARAGRALATLDSGASGRTMGRWAIALLVLLALQALVVLRVQLAGLRQDTMPEVYAHRGASFKAPENTLASIRAAIEDGADWVEIDVQETREGEVVVAHDRDLMRLGGVPLDVWDTPLKKLQTVDVGSYRDSAFAAERVPLLSEVLDLARGQVKLNIELKYYGREQRLEERVATLVASHGMADEVVYMSLSLPGVRAMKALRPGATVGLLSTVAVGDVTRLGVDFFAVNADFASRKFLDRARRRNKQVLTWTVNDPAGMSAMMSKGVDGIITDRPGLARKVLAQRAELSVPERLLVLFASELGSDYSEAP